jgi:hypothetical protein
MQALPDGHAAFWQAPQCISSVARSTHEPPQFARPAGHATTHCPAEHAWLRPHATEQLPQWRGSTSRSVQVWSASQAVRPFAHESAQRPATQA